MATLGAFLDRVSDSVATFSTAFMSVNA